MGMVMPALLFAQGNKYTITGRVGHLSAPAKAYLYCSEDGLKSDSVVMKDGVFLFKGTIEDPISTYIVINKKGTGISSREVDFIEFYLEPGMIKVISPDSLGNAVISGGPLNTENEKLKKVLEPYTRQMNTLDKEYMAASPEKRKSKEFEKYYSNKSDSIEGFEKAIYLDYIKNNPDSAYSLFVVQKYAGYVPDVARVEPAFNLLSTELKASKAGMAYAAKVATMKHSAIGAEAPDFTMADTSGHLVSLHDFRGKYVLVDFWSSWCGPCRAENPNVVKAYAVYKDKNFEILGVSLDQDNARAKWIKAINDDHLTWPQVSDLKGWKNEAAALYSVQAIPQNFLVSPEGKIVAKNITGEALTNKLKELLDK